MTADLPLHGVSSGRPSCHQEAQEQLDAASRRSAVGRDAAFLLDAYIEDVASWRKDSRLTSRPSPVKVAASLLSTRLYAEGGEAPWQNWNIESRASGGMARTTDVTVDFDMLDDNAVIAARDTMKQERVSWTIEGRPLRPVGC